jgi:hypothetical protein
MAEDVQDPALVETYASSVKARLCPCGDEPVGFFQCRHTKSGSIVNLFSCQRCLDIETTWTTTRIPDPAGPPATGQLELMI